MPQKIVILNPGESQVVGFEIVPQVAKTYQIEVDGLTGSFIAVAAPIMLNAAQVVTVMAYVYWWPSDEDIINLVAPLTLFDFGGRVPTGPLAFLRLLGIQFYTQCGGGPPVLDPYRYQWVRRNGEIMACFLAKREAWWNAMSEAQKEELRLRVFNDYKTLFLGTYSQYWAPWAPISAEDLIARSGNPEKAIWAIENLL